MEDVADLHSPFANDGFVKDAPANPHLLREITAADPAHYKIIASGLDKVVEYGWNRRMIELSKHFGLAFEVLYCLGPLTLVGEHLDHFFYRAEAIGEPFVAGLIDGSHAAAADTVDDRIPVEQQRSGFELLALDGFWLLRLRHTILGVSASSLQNYRPRRQRHRVLPGTAFSTKRVSRAQVTAAIRTEHKLV